MQYRRTLRRSIILCAVTMTALGAAVASSAPKEPAPGVLAVVNGEAIRAEAVEQHLKRIHGTAEEGQTPGFDLDQLMFKLVNDTLIGQEARALGMDEEPEIVEQLAELREDLSLRLFEKEKIGDRAAATEEEIERTFQDQYRVVELRTVSSYDEEGSRKMLEELRAGADMEAMAREKSVDPIRTRGGLMKPAPRIDLQREVAEVAFSLERGELGGPIRTKLGWTVIRVESFADADPARLEEVRGTVAGLIRLEKTKQIRADLEREARARHKVEIHREVVDAIVPEKRPDQRWRPKVPDPGAIVARIGSDRSITAKAYGAALADRWTGVRNEEAAIAASPVILGRMIQRNVLLAEAKRLGYPERPEVNRRVEARETQLLIPKYLEEIVAPGVEIQPDELEAYYNQHKNEFLRPPRMRLSQITVESMEEAERIAALLRDGADMSWLAKQHSIDRFKEKGGDRGWYTPTPGVDPFNEALLAAQPGDVLDPFGDEGNFVIVKVLTREEQGPYPFGQVSGNVREALFAEKFEEVLDRFIKTLRSRSEITIYDDRVAALRIRGSVKDGTAHAGGDHSHGR